ncbi:hypothetical protein J6590_105036 [Homalodisca vitripennis]|nr:hypothetical protein J6590_105036 [Homalodisca vitripennis]
MNLSLIGLSLFVDNKAVIIRRSSLSTDTSTVFTRRHQDWCYPQPSGLPIHAGTRTVLSAHTRTVFTRRHQDWCYPQPSGLPIHAGTRTVLSAHTRTVFIRITSIVSIHD